MHDDGRFDVTIAAGLRFRERWSGWQREPFTNVSDKHVSVWEKPSVSAATE